MPGSLHDLLDQALCRKSRNPDTWFPGQDALGREAAKVAKSICDACPVQVECLEDGLRSKETDGIWGSTLPEERADMVPSRRRGGTALLTKTRKT